MTAVELFANQPQTTVSSGGTDAPSSGTTQTWTVTSSAEFPAASSSATPPTQFHIIDTAPAAVSEIIAVTNVSGTTWSATRGAESTTPVAHSSGFTVQQVLTAGALGGFLQAGDVPTLNQSTTGNAATATNLAGDTTFPARIAPKVVTLTDGSSVALDSSAGNLYRWPLGGSSHTLSAPSNPEDGDTLVLRIIYSGAYTPLFDVAYLWGASGQPAWSAASGQIDEAGFAYSADAASGSGAWICRGSELGYS